MSYTSRSGRTRSRRAAALAATFALTLTMAPAAPAAFNFAPPLDSIAGDFPQAVTTGDLNEDGRADVVTADWESGTVSVLIAHAGGGFEPPEHYAVDEGPRSIALADLNLDGRLDIATASSNRNTMSYLLGKAGGGFAAAHTEDFPADGPSSIAAGHVDENPYPDLVTANTVSNNLSVFYGGGAPSVWGFEKPFLPEYGGTHPQAVEIADVNGNGRNDLVFAHDGGVSLLLGAGSRTFDGPLHYEAGQDPSDLAVGDLNRDGRLDLAVANWRSGDVSVLLGKEQNGLFASHVDYEVGARPLAVAMGDLDGDGWQDLVVGHAQEVAVLLANGDGTFRTAVDHDVDTEVYDATVADVNGDGRLDVVAVGYDVVSVLVNASTPAATPSRGSVAFGRTAVGASSASRVLTFTNRGHASLDVSGGRIAGADADEFRITSNDCAGESLRPGESCQVALRFAPVAEGVAHATLRLASNDPARPSVALTGTGTPVARESRSGPKGPGKGAVVECSSKRDARGGLTTRCPVAFTAVAGNRVLSGRLARGTKVYASQRRIVHPGRGEIVLRGHRPIPRGRYLLLLRFTNRDGSVRLVAQHVHVR